MPYIYFNQSVEIHAYPKRIEIFNLDAERIALHIRRFTGKRYSTQEDHMPANHQAVLAFRARDGGDYRRIAAGIGENTVRFIDSMLRSGPIEEQFYKSCNGILFSFRKKYGDEILEAACTKALSIQSYTYTTIKNILEKGQYKIPAIQSNAKPTPRHKNLRIGEWV